MAWLAKEWSICEQTCFLQILVPDIYPIFILDEIRHASS